jgi:hypothetical protein
MAKKRKTWWVWPPSSSPAVKYDRAAGLAARVADYRAKLLSGDYEIVKGENGHLHVWRKRRTDRSRCGAKTRAGGPCLMRVVPGKARCRLHGGLSTGPITDAGREAIRESNRRRGVARWVV